MICERCNASFDPSPEVAHLIAIGKIPQLCDACAKPEPSLFVSSRPLVTKKRTKNSILRRVDLFKPDGTTIRWFSLMPDYPKPGKKRIPRPHRPGDNLRVFVMTERSDRGTGHPRMKLFTNLETFQRQGVPFKAWKAPDHADVLTGVDHVKLNEVVRVEDDGSLEINIYSKDGSWVRLLYKN